MDLYGFIKMQVSAQMWLKWPATGNPWKSVYDVTTKRIFGGAMAVDGGISKPVESLIHWQFWDGKAWTGTTSRW